MPNRSGRERAYSYLRTALLSDPTLPGGFISEQEVADAVGVSRTPVREALLILDAEGLVELLPNRGAYVAPLTPDTVHEILQARRMIESWAIEDVLQRRTAPVNAMRDAIAEQERLAGDGSPADFIAADRTFHTALIDALGNATMSRLYDVLRARHVVIGVAALENEVNRRADVIAEHRAIIDALAAGDGERAQAAMAHHLDTTHRMLLGADHAP